MIDRHVVYLVHCWPPCYLWGGFGSLHSTSTRPSTSRLSRHNRRGYFWCNFRITKDSLVSMSARGYQRSQRHRACTRKWSFSSQRSAMYKEEESARISLFWNTAERGFYHCGEKLVKLLNFLFRFSTLRVFYQAKKKRSDMRKNPTNKQWIR